MRSAEMDCIGGRPRRRGYARREGARPQANQAGRRDTANHLRPCHCNGEEREVCGAAAALDAPPAESRIETKDHHGARPLRELVCSGGRRGAIFRWGGMKCRRSDKWLETKRVYNAPGRGAWCNGRTAGGLGEQRIRCVTYSPIRS